MAFNSVEHIRLQLLKILSNWPKTINKQQTYVKPKQNSSEQSKREKKWQGALFSFCCCCCCCYINTVLLLPALIYIILPCIV